MALVTGLNELAARDGIKANWEAGRFDDLRERFLRYVLKIDDGRVGIPPILDFSNQGVHRGFVSAIILL
jgi:hypothetical protein